jgi:hypothetical protein
MLRPENAREVLTRLKGLNPSKLSSDDVARLTWAKTQYDKTKVISSPADKFESEPALERVLEPAQPAPAPDQDHAARQSFESEWANETEHVTIATESPPIAADPLPRASDTLPDWMRNPTTDSQLLVDEPVWVERILNGRMTVSGPFQIAEMTETTARLVKAVV